MTMDELKVIKVSASDLKTIVLEQTLNLYQKHMKHIIQAAGGSVTLTKEQLEGDCGCDLEMVAEEVDGGVRFTLRQRETAGSVH